MPWATISNGLFRLYVYHIIYGDIYIYINNLDSLGAFLEQQHAHHGPYYDELHHGP